MAVLKDNGMGFPSGRRGNDVYRHRNGKTILCARPGPYNKNPENQKNCIAPKSKFGYASWFATFTNKIPELKKIWKKEKLKGLDPYHKMMSYNIKRCEITRLTVKNVITPPSLILEVKEAAFTADGINAHLEIKDDYLLTPFKAIAVIYSFNPGKERNADYGLFAVNFEISGPAVKEFDLAFQPEQEYINEMRGHRNWIMYFAVVKDDDPRQLLWTSTAAAQGTNEFYVQEKYEPAEMENSNALCYPCNYCFTSYNDLRI